MGELNRPLVAKRGRLLAVASSPPWPASNGMTLRIAKFLEELAQRWDITVVSPEAESAEDATPPGIRWVRVPDVPGGDTLVRHAERPHFVRAIQALLHEESFDAGLTWYGAEFVATDIPGFPPSVADRIDCGTLTAWRELRHPRGGGVRDWLRTARRTTELFSYERRMLRPYHAVAVTGPADGNSLAKISRHPRIVIVPNGVAIPADDGPGESPTPTVIFTGVLSYPPNVDAIRYFVREIWPEVREHVSNARFVIAGRWPNAEVESFGTLPGVELHLEVPDMTHELRRAWVAVAPMQTGAGVKNKVLEAWAAGRPAVMTPMATNGLHLDEGTTELVAADAAQFRSIVLDLLNDPERRRRLGAAARRLVEANHTWPKVTEGLHELLMSAAGK